MARQCDTHTHNSAQVDIELGDKLRADKATARIEPPVSD